MWIGAWILNRQIGTCCNATVVALNARFTPRGFQRVCRSCTAYLQCRFFGAYLAAQTSQSCAIQIWASVKATLP